MFETQGSTKTGTGLPDFRRPFLEATVGLAARPEPFGFARGRLREGNPRMRVLQDPTLAIQTLARFGRIPGKGLGFQRCLGDRNP